MTDHLVGRRIVSQTFLVVAERGILLVPQVTIVLLITRLHGKEFFGEYALILTWAAAFQLLAQFGITECLSRELGRSGKIALFTHGLVLSMILAIAASLVMVVAAPAFHYSADTTLGIWIAAGMILPVNLAATSRGALLASGQTEYTTLVSALEAVLVLPVNVWWVLKNVGVIPIIATITAGKLISSLVLLFLVHRRVMRIGASTGWRDLSFIWGRLLPFGIASVMVFPSVRYDVIFLSKLSTVAAVGTYAASIRVLDLLFILPLAFFMVMLPRAAVSFASPERDVEWARNTVRRYLMVVVPIAVGVLGYAEPIVHLLFGGEFAQAAGILRIHMAVFLLLSVDVVLAMFIKADMLQRVDLGFVVVTTALNIVLNVLWIPAWGPRGAALALGGSVSIGTLLRWNFVERRVAKLPWLEMVGIPLVLSLILMAACRSLLSWVWWPASALAYLTVYAVTMSLLTPRA